MKDSTKQFLKYVASSFVGGAVLLVVRDIYYDIKGLRDTGDFDRMVKNIQNARVNVYHDPWDDEDDIGDEEEEEDFLFPPEYEKGRPAESVTSEDRVFDWDALRKKAPIGDDITPIGPAVTDRIVHDQSTLDMVRKNVDELMTAVQEIRVDTSALLERAKKKDSAKETKKKNKKAAEALMHKTAEEIIGKASEESASTEVHEAESPKKTEKKNSKK